MDTAASTVTSNTPPVGYVTAVWLGMSPEAIARGIAQGIITPPPGWSEPAAMPMLATDGAGTSAEGSPEGDVAAAVLDAADKPDVKPLLVDRELVLGLFRKLDPSFDDDAFDALWSRAGATDAERSASWLDTLSRTLGTGVPSLSEPTTGDRMAAQMDALQSFLAQPGHEAKVVDLTGKSGDALFELAKGDPAYRYALLNLHSIAVVGNAAIDAGHDGAGAVDRFDPNSGEQKLSDAYLADRAKLLAWKLSIQAGGTDTVDGDDSWTFIDRRNPTDAGVPYELRLQSGAQNATQNTVVFGADTPSGEVLKGASGTDRMYGGSGDDVLRGNAGGDHLEGGGGDDLVLGGAGNDDMSGDQGADELDGGAGTDRLRGGAGDDMLTGGRGDDRLEGGIGHDTYAIDAGDGQDTIVDSDGDGEVQLDGVALSGSDEAQDGTWRSTDGRVRYSFSGDAADGGTLTISYYASADAPATATPDTVTKIDGWHNGDLGITLGDGSAAALGGAAASQSAGTPPHNSTIPLIPHDEGTSGSDGEGSAGIDPASSDGNDSGIVSLDAPDADPMSSVDVADLFDQLSSHSHIADSLVTPAVLHAAVMAWDGVAEAPDIAVHQDATMAVAGVTPSDLTDALADFHDAGHDLSDLALEAPSLNAASSPIDFIGTSEGVSSSAGSGDVSGTGQRPRP